MYNSAMKKYKIINLNYWDIVKLESSLLNYVQMKREAGGQDFRVNFRVNFRSSGRPAGMSRHNQQRSLLK